MALIDVKNLSFRYGKEYIFDNVSFQIDTNWKLGLVGRNGRGKTTLLQLLLGKYEYQGSITTNQKFLYFPFIVHDSTMMTLHVVEELYPMYEYWRLQKEISLLGMNEEVLYRPFETLSKGEQTKVLLAILFLQEDCFILIDEPTNHLDIEGRKIVSKYLQKKKNFILVCHDRNFMDCCVDHILAINKTTIDIQSGNFSSWYVNKERQDHVERVANNRLKKEIRQLTEATKRSKQWSDKVEKSKNGTRVAGLRPDKGRIGHLAAKMMQKAKNTERRAKKHLEEKKNLLKNVEEVESLNIPSITYKKRQFMQLQNVSIFYDNKQVCNTVNVSIEQGDRIAIIGKNGSGKSSIIKAILGQLNSYQGTILCGEDLIISYVAQSIDMLEGQLLTYLKRNNIDETRCLTVLRKMDFSRSLFTIPIEQYSDGQKKKVLLASALTKPAHLYIFDEPLNYIDVFSRIQIEKMIACSEATMIFVEHDITFVNRIKTKVINLDH